MVKDKGWSGFAIAGFVLSLIGFSFFPLSILGIIFSAKGLKETSNNKKRGRGLANAGMVLSIILLAVIIIGIVWAALIPMVRDGLS